MLRISSVAFAALLCGLLVATIVDVKSRRIPNALTAAMAGIGFGLAAAGVSGVSFGAAAIGFLVGFALMVPGHALGATGAGDVKLMAAVGAIVGPGLVVNAFLFTAIAGGVLALAVAVRRQRFTDTLTGTARMIAAPSDVRHDVRTASASRRFAYGPAIAVGSVLAVLVG